MNGVKFSRKSQDEPINLNSNLKSKKEQDNSLSKKSKD